MSTNKTHLSCTVNTDICDFLEKLGKERDWSKSKCLRYIVNEYIKNSKFDDNNDVARKAG